MSDADTLIHNSAGLTEWDTKTPKFELYYENQTIKLGKLVGVSLVEIKG
jgi:hypothetical protein